MKFPESPALSIIKNGPHSFASRKLGVLVTDGADGSISDAIQAGAKKHGAAVEVVAPHIGGFTDSGGRRVEAGQKIDGRPSVLYDAVVLLLSDEGAMKLAANPRAKDFVSDAFSHYKLIGYTQAARPLLEAAGIAQDLDGGCVLLDKPDSVTDFLERCRALRWWDREMKMS